MDELLSVFSSILTYLLLVCRTVDAAIDSTDGLLSLSSQASLLFLYFDSWNGVHMSPGEFLSASVGFSTRHRVLMIEISIAIAFLILWILGTELVNLANASACLPARLFNLPKVSNN